MRILGIDPGLNHTGFGVIDCDGSHFRLVDAGCIHVPTGDLCDRLAVIHKELAAVIAATRPTHAACELVFVNVNPKATLLLGQARGTAIACAAVAGLKVDEFTPAQIKQAVVGSGRATKEQVQHMIARLLNLSQTPQSDAADALACAITCAHSMRLKSIETPLAARSKTGIRTLSSKSKQRAAWQALVLNRKETE
jgi:crossover junction endodeoxyribonuclease RuvC